MSVNDHPWRRVMPASLSVVLARCGVLPRCRILTAVTGGHVLPRQDGIAVRPDTTGTARDFVSGRAGRTRS